MSAQVTLRLMAIVVCFGGLLLAGCTDISLRRYAQITGYERTFDAYSQTDTTITDVTNTRDEYGRDAKLLSAFFGLDNALPKRVSDRIACEGAGGSDGMPVIFSHEIDNTTLEPGDFRVITASGAIGNVVCLTLAPADEPGELRTALLAGQYGSIDDQPVTVEIIGNVLSLDGGVNFKGTRINVTALENGPTIVRTEIVPMSQWNLGTKATSLPWGGGNRCPAGTLQVVRAIWSGGITKPGGKPADDQERALYKVTVKSPAQSPRDVTPFALADLNDGDNNHLLCLDTPDPALFVSFPAGHLTDPREDFNPATSMAVTHTGQN